MEQLDPAKRKGGREREREGELISCDGTAGINAFPVDQQEVAGVSPPRTRPTLPRPLSFFINHYRQVAGPCDIEWVCSGAHATQRSELISSSALRGRKCSRHDSSMKHPSGPVEGEGEDEN